MEKLNLNRSSIELLIDEKFALASQTSQLAIRQTKNFYRDLKSVGQNLNVIDLVAYRTSGVSFDVLCLEPSDFDDVFQDLRFIVHRPKEDNTYLGVINTDTKVINYTVIALCRDDCDFRKFRDIKRLSPIEYFDLVKIYVDGSLSSDSFGEEQEKYFETIANCIQISAIAYEAPDWVLET